MPATVHRAEALAFLANQPAGSVDAVITDPPYSSGGMTRSDRNQSVHAKYVQSDAKTGSVDLQAFAGDGRDQRGYSHWMALWLAEALRVAKPGAAVCLFTDWRQLPATTDAIQAGGWIWRGIVPWHKPSARPTQGRFTAACEYVVWGTAGPRPLGSLDGKALPGFYQASPPRDREHITQKPLDVMRALVKIAPPGGTVLDPFAGSGQTGVAAVLEGRDFLGAEITEHYHEVAERRIRKTEQGHRDSPGQQVLGD